MVLIEPSDPREPGENFRFISEVVEIFSDDSFQDYSDRVNLIASTGKFGIIFIANQTCIKVFKSNQLIDAKDKTPITTFQPNGLVTHLSTNSDGQILFVVSIVNYTPFGFFYDVCHIMQKASGVVPFYSTPLSTNIGTRVASVSWNPCDSVCIAIALSTGELSLLRIKESSVEFSKKTDLGANSVTWSAKGKQLAVGKKDGTLSLFKPDLVHVREIEAPSVPGIGPVIDITWFTNTEFFIGYLNNDNLPGLFYVAAPKGKPATFVNFEDVCYSSESGRPVSYYSFFISEWNLLFVFSSNGIEMGLIGKTDNDAGECKWCQWFPDEGARASIQLYNVTEETFPLGLTLDLTSQKTFPTKEEKAVAGPFPSLISLSTKGVLNIFFVENKLAETQTLTFPSENLPLTAFRTPEQFGQPTQPESQVAAPAQPSTELKRTSLSAFSSIPKKSETESHSSFFFSTPVKPLYGGAQPSKQPLSPFPVVSSVALAGSASSFTNVSSSFSFSSPVTSTGGIPFGLTSSITTTSSILSTNTANTSSVFSFTPIGSTPSSLFAPPPSINSFCFGPTSSSTNTFSFAPSTSSFLAPPTTTSSFSFVPSSTTTSSFSFAPSVSTSSFSFSSPNSSLISKPVSLSSKIVSTSLPAPSPQKSTPQAVPVIISSVAPPSQISPQTQTISSPTSQPQKGQTSLQTIGLGHKPTRDSLLLHINREKDLFEREIRELCIINNGLQCQVGTERENKDISSSLSVASDWINDMRKTIQEQSEEVVVFHQKTLEALASYEDANSYKETKFGSRNQVYLQLRRLDPYSQRKLDEVRFRYQYLVSQMSEVNAKMELQWEENSAMKKPKKLTREQKCATESLYRSLLNLHNKRIAAEKEVDAIVGQLKKLSLGPLCLSSAFPYASRDAASTLLPSLTLSSSPKCVAKSQTSPRTKQLRVVLAQRSRTPVRVQSSSESPKPFSIEGNQGAVYSPKGLGEGELNSSVQISRRSVVSAVASLYENISPPSSPEKGQNVANPLAALSSLVGQVATPEISATPAAGLVSNSVTVKNEPLGDASSSSGSAGVSASTASLLLGQTVQSEGKSFFNFSSSNALKGFSVGGTGGSVTPPFQISLKPAPSTPELVSTSDIFSGQKISFQGFGGIGGASRGMFSASTPTVQSQGVPAVVIESSGVHNSGVGIKASSESPATSFNFNFNTVSGENSNIVSPSSGFFTSSLVSVSNKEQSPSSKDVGSPLSSTSAPSATPNVTSQSISVFKTEENVTSFATSSSPKESANVAVFSPLLSKQILKEALPISSGESSTSDQGTVFVQPSSTSSFSFASLQSSLFGQGTPTSSQSSTAVTSGANVAATLTAAGSSQPDKAFADSAIFAQPSAKAPSIFGLSSTSAAVPGQSSTSITSIFGQPTSSAPSIFGHPASSTASVFEQAYSKASESSSVDQKSVNTNSSLFSQTGQPTSTSSILRQPSPTTSSIFVVSLFGEQPSSTSSSASAQPSSAFSTVTTSVNQTSTTPTLFGQSSSSLFDATNATAQTTLSSPTTTSSSSGFGQVIPSTGSLFGKPSGGTPLFGQSTLQPSASVPAFGQAGISAFGAVVATSSSSETSATSDKNIFESSAAPTTQSSIFEIPTSTNQSSIFETSAATTTQSSIFGKPAAATQSNIFGTPSTTKSLFGVPTTSGQSLFGTPSSTQNFFGGPAVTSQSIFGTSATTQSIFGTPTTTQSIFGTPSTTTQSIFGAAAATTQTSIFGIPSTTQSIFGTSATTTQSIFGTPTTTAQSLFGTPTTTGQSIFGSNSGSLFGKPPSTEVQPGTSAFGTSGSSGQSPFGSTGTPFQPSSFGTGSVFGQPAATASQSSNSPSVFNAGSTGVFGSQSTGSVFGSNVSSGSIFGNTPSSPSQPSLFGGGSFSSAFGQTAAASSSPFSGGSMFSGLGTAPSKEDANKNVFGIVKSGATPQTNLFGDESTGSPFGGSSATPKPGGAFSPVKTGGPTFGGAATFGGSTTFGGGAVFGGSPPFGGSPALGGGSASVFGSNTSAFSSGGFGSFSSTGSSGPSAFGSLGSQQGGSNFTSWR